MNKFRICPTPSFQYNKLRKFVNSLLANTLHGHSLKTLILIAQAFLEVRRAILSELAREIPLPIHFKHRLRRLWRFCAKTAFDYQAPCQRLITWVLSSLKDRPYLEIILDWTQIRKDHVLAFSIPYHKRSIPIFWFVAAPDDFSPNQSLRICITNFLSAVPRQLRNKLIFVADRGFADVEFFRFLIELNVNFVIRVCGKVSIKTKEFRGWIMRLPLSPGKVKWLPHVRYHRTKNMTLNLLLKYDKDDPLYIVSNIDCADTVLRVYARRMRIEEGFRDMKDGLLFKRLRLSRADKVGKMLLVGVLVYLFALMVGSQAEKNLELIKVISLLPRRKNAKKLLSVFRIGLIIITRCPSLKLPLQLVPEAL